MAQHDHRPSSTLNLFYGNKTVPATMAGLWTTYNVGIAYIYGNFLQVLFTGLGYVDFITKFNSFAYSTYVALKVVSQPPALRNRTWRGILTEWVGLECTNIVQDSNPSSGDVLLIVGVHTGSAYTTIRQAVRLANHFVKNGAKVILVLKPGQTLPRDLIVQSGIAGAYSTTQNAFMEQVVDNSVQQYAANGIFLFGEGTTLVATALGALDHWLRRPGVGKENMNKFVHRVTIDVESPILFTQVNDFADALGQLAIPVVPLHEDLLVDLQPDDSQLQLTPVQQ